MSKQLKTRLACLERANAERDSEPLRIFATVIGLPLQGFVAHHPPGPAIARQDGESVEALEARCAAEAPGVQIWRST